MTTEDRVRTLLSDLGKATLRGIKKCPKCGTYNGSRGTCCKNKLCDAVFKESGEKKKQQPTIEACRLITGSLITRLFSVRSVVKESKGPEYRGFVQLPCVDLTLENELPQSSLTLCFVENCEKSFFREKNTPNASASTCQHVQAVTKCYVEAQPLALKNSVLSTLNANDEIKQELWLLSKTPGPLVQRVSKNLMAVKCKTSSNRPLAYLHILFFTTKSKDRIEHKFVCNCSSNAESNNKNEDKIKNLRCVHFYACLCIFTSDTKLSEEFQHYINFDRYDFHPPRELFELELNNTEADEFTEMDLETHLLIFRDNALSMQNLQSDRLDFDNLNFEPSILTDSIVDAIKDDEYNLLDSYAISDIQNLEVIDQNAVFEGVTDKIIHNPVLLEPSHSLLDFKPANSTTMKILDPNLIITTNNKLFDNTAVPINPKILKKPAVRKTIPCKRKREKKSLSSISNLNCIESSRATKKFPDTFENLDESAINLSFVAWLSSITERINQTMHFQFNGKPEPLVFHVPQTFFECLRERISFGAKKKRLPNTTTAFVRRDSVPLGTFTKYTWNITNVLHVKSIFDTPLLPLEVTRSFIQNPDGTYELYKRKEEELDRFKKTSNNAFIKPFELKTYLKVGNTSPNQVQPTPFLIEWIPDILPISKIGELRIKFEFGHIKITSKMR